MNTATTTDEYMQAGNPIAILTIGIARDTRWSCCS